MEFHVKQDSRKADGVRVNRDPAFPFPLTPSQVAALARYEELLLERASALGLISDRDLPILHDRHVLDSLRPAALFAPEDELAVDLGSGAGLPGLVLAIALPRCAFVLVEPRRKRVGFLELAVERLGLTNVEIAMSRTEDLRMEGDVVTARAFAPLARTWATALPLLRPGGRLIYFAGSRGAAEARSLTLDPPPARVEVAEGLANGPPLVIMARG
jgi:16S rRNA (guanine527-N7)-methyltransferase